MKEGNQHVMGNEEGEGRKQTENEEEEEEEEDEEFAGGESLKPSFEN